MADNEQSKRVGYILPSEDDRKVVPFDLGNDGIAFVKSELDQTGPLSLMVLKLFAYNGKSFAPLDEGSTLEEVKEFESGQWYPSVNIKKWVADYVLADFGADSRFVFADPWYNAEDYKQWPPEGNYFFCESIPYFIPTAGSLYDMLMQGSKEVKSYLYPVFVVNPVTKLPESGKNVSLDYMAELAHNTKAILVSAYDQEGYVIWEKSNPE